MYTVKMVISGIICNRGIITTDCSDVSLINKKTLDESPNISIIQQTAIKNIEIFCLMKSAYTNIGKCIFKLHNNSKVSRSLNEFKYYSFNTYIQNQFPKLKLNAAKASPMKKLQKQVAAVHAQLTTNFCCIDGLSAT